MIDLFYAHASQLDFFLILLGLSVTFVSRFRTLSLMLRVTILLVQMARWYMKTHPEGKLMAKQSSIDENLEAFYHKHIKHLEAKVTPPKG